MSTSAQGDASSKKEVVGDGANNTTDQQKPGTALEEDDEFEDFPVQDWVENMELPATSTHLWEESWDDDDTSEDFSAQLKEELKKVEAKRS